MTEEKKLTKEEQFAKEYKELCDKLGVRIVVVPTWAPTNHGTFELTLQYSIGELPKQ